MQAAINLRSQKVLPFAKFALEAHALRYLERCDDAPLDLLAGFVCSFAGFADTPCGTDRGGIQICRARRAWPDVREQQHLWDWLQSSNGLPSRHVRARQSKERFAHSGQ